MSASLHPSDGGNPAAVGVSHEASGITESFKNQPKALETPRIFLSSVKFDTNSKKSNSGQASQNPHPTDSIGQGTPTVMKLKASSKIFPEIVEYKSSSDDEDDDEDSFPNYVLSSSAEEGLSYCSAVGTSTTWYPPTMRASNNSSSQVVNETTCLRGPSEPKPAPSIYPANTGVSSQPNFAQNLKPKPVIGTDFEDGISPKAPQLESCSDQNSSASNPRYTTPSVHEMKVRLEHECCMGIGSWSKDGTSSIGGVENNMPGEVVDSVPSHIYAMFEKNWLEGVTQCPNGQRRPQPSQFTNSQTQSTTGPSSLNIPFGTYERHSQEHGADEDDSDEDLPKKRGRKAASGDAETNGPRLACPFNKHDPQFFRANSINGPTFRCCAGPGFEDIARVKAHLYRLHRTPINCPLCGSLFNAQEELNDHLRSRTCEVQAPVPLKSITDEIEKKLKNRRKSGLSPAERWKEIYQLIFPNEQNVPSPYYGPSDVLSPSGSEFLETDDHEAFSCRELPQVFREALDVTFQGQLPESPEEFKCLLVARLNDCQKQVSLRYHSSQQTAIQSIYDTETAMCTPKALSNSFESLSSPPGQSFDVFNVRGTRTKAPLSWHQTYDAPSITYHQLSYPQEGQSSQADSMDLPHGTSRDSGYGTNSVCYCSGNCSCYDPSDMNRNSYDGGTRITSFPDVLGILPDHPNTGSGPVQSSILTSIPRTNGDLSSLDYFKFYDSPFELGS